MKAPLRLSFALPKYFSSFATPVSSIARPFPFTAMSSAAALADPLTGGKLTHEYGPEPTNYYGGTALNRVSFLREDYAFAHEAINHPSTRFLPLKGLTPPVSVAAPESESAPSTEEWNTPRPAQYSLKFVTRESEGVADFLGQPFKTPEEEQVKNWDSKRDAVGAEDRPLLVFLGLDETASGDNLFSYTRPGANEVYKGIPYFALDLDPSYLKSKSLQEKAQRILDGPELAEPDVTFSKFPMRVRFSRKEASLLAQARMYTDWNERNRFCGGCGKPNMSVNAGTKLTCPPTDAGAELPACATRGRISNLSFPRTDCSIIAAVVNHAGDKLLLGRNKRFPPGFFSCLAGFLEPAETIEDCVRREIWEESGVKVGRVLIHSTQPWPYPANLMVGCVAQVADSSKESHTIHLGHDPELGECDWYDIKELQKTLAVAAHDDMFERPKELKEGQPQLPMREAIAYTLIEAVVNGRVRGIQTN